jgi:hypothetical protein
MKSGWITFAFSVFLTGCERPAQTYSAACSTPLSNWRTEKDGLIHEGIALPVYVGSDGTILWDKNNISDAQLGTYMRELHELNPVPLVVLEISPSAPCKRVKAIRTIMDAAPVCKGPHSHCGEGWNWREWSSGMKV